MLRDQSKSSLTQVEESCTLLLQYPNNRRAAPGARTPCMMYARYMARVHPHHRATLIPFSSQNNPLRLSNTLSSQSTFADAGKSCRSRDPRCWVKNKKCAQTVLRTAEFLVRMSHNAGLAEFLQVTESRITIARATFLLNHLAFVFQAHFVVPKHGIC